MKKIQLFFFAMLCYGTLTAQSLEQGVSLFNEEQYAKAKQVLTVVNKQQPSAEACYLLGQLYFKLAQVDSAEVFYQQGITINPKYGYNYSGLGKVQLQKGNASAAQANFEKVKKIAKKDVKLLVSVVDAALSGAKKDTAIAHYYLNLVQEINPKASDYYLFTGDFNVQIRNLGQAINDYNNALFYGADREVVGIRLGALYARLKNIKESEASYKKILESKPDAILVYKKMGDMYYSFGKYPEAKDSYKTYFSKVSGTEDEKEKYALILFFNKNYDETESLIKEIAAENKDNAVLYRVRAYTAYERADYKNGLDFINQFFTIQKPEKVIALDYEYNGKFLLANKDSIGATKKLLKAYDLDTTKFQDVEDAGKILSKLKKHKEAIACYKILSNNPLQDGAANAYLMGKEYYFDGIEQLELSKKSPELKNSAISQLNNADSCFSIVISLSPKFVAAYKWKANTLVSIDPDAKNDNAKKAYEALLTAAQTAAQPDNGIIIECYRYFASYYYLQSERFPQNSELRKSNKKTSIEYFEKILVLNPGDKQATESLVLLKKN